MRRLGQQVRWLPLLPLLAGAASACLARPPRTPEAAGDPGKVLDDLAMLTVGATLPPARRRAMEQALAEGRATLESTVAELLADPRFAREVAPEIVFNKKAVDPAEEDAFHALEATSDRPPVYYLRKPCRPDEAVAVHPWWALDTEVRVCPDSYQPDHLRQPETGWFCGGSNLDPLRSPFCGCGPNLMLCARDEGQLQAIKRGLMDELTATVAHVVEHDLPLASLFTGNETVRGGYSEIFYQRWEVAQGLRAGVGDGLAFPGAPALAPRAEATPGQHAGLLTSPQILLYGDTPRARMRNAFSDLWCVTPSSVNVSAAQVLGLGGPNLRDGDGWKKLARMPVCTDCHARLDHGMQFFSGYPSSFVGVVYAPRAPRPRPETYTARGHLYGFGHEDLRGEGPLTPRGFAELAVKQPEFGRCMVRDVADHVWGGDAGPDDRRALLQAFEREGTLRAVMREALLRFARRAPAGGLAPPPAPALRAQLDAHCQACHDDGAHAFPRGGALPRDLLAKMLRQVAFGDMPRAPGEIDAAERHALVRGLIEALWADDGARREASRYFAGGMRGLRAHRGSAILGMIEDRASAYMRRPRGATTSRSVVVDLQRRGPARRRRGAPLVRHHLRPGGAPDVPGGRAPGKGARRLPGAGAGRGGGSEGAVKAVIRGGRRRWWSRSRPRWWCRSSGPRSAWSTRPSTGPPSG